MAYKIAIIGGGSSTFTPQLMRLFIRSDILRGSTVVLMDIDAKRLEVMTNLCRKLAEKENAELKVEKTTNRKKSLKGADFVISSIAVGSFDAWEKDFEIPAKYGIYMPIADSVGPGGIMRAFRHIPILVKMCQELEELSPDAWVFNYTNPATSNCRAMRRASSIKSFSLCTCSTIPHGVNEYLASLTNIDPKKLRLPAPAAGINHCAGILELYFKDGRDALALIKKKVKRPFIKWVLETYGILPYCWEHWIEFFPFHCRLEDKYKGRFQGMKMQHDVTVQKVKNHRLRARKWERLAEKWTRGENAKLSLDILPPDEAVQVVEVMESIIENRNEVHVMNLPNQGAIENLPDEAVVEVSSVVGSYGIRPVCVGALPETLAATLRQQISVQELTVEAALTGSRKTALEAFMQDPQIHSVLTPKETEKLLDELLKAHSEYLPRFR